MVTGHRYWVGNLLHSACRDSWRVPGVRLWLVLYRRLIVLVLNVVRLGKVTPLILVAMIEILHDVVVAENGPT